MLAHSPSFWPVEPLFFINCAQEPASYDEASNVTWGGGNDLDDKTVFSDLDM